MAATLGSSGARAGPHQREECPRLDGSNLRLSHVQGVGQRGGDDNRAPVHTRGGSRGGEDPSE